MQQGGGVRAGPRAPVWPAPATRPAAWAPPATTGAAATAGTSLLDHAATSAGHPGLIWMTMDAGVSIFLYLITFLVTMENSSNYCSCLKWSMTEYQTD